MSMSASHSEQLLSFYIGGDEYAVGVLLLREIVSCEACGPITWVPSMPRFIRGATSLRGRAIPVIDLALKFGFAQTEISRWTCLLLTRIPIGGELTTLGVLVDRVSSLLDVTEADIEPPPPLGTRVHPRYVRGLVRASEKLLLVLDLQRVLSREELLQVTAVQPVVTAVTPDAAKP
jgi:purine-binding chemotaxis protein CheW